jgi:NAD(P)-dependent dehydrogenase (short-subunit alcohol dehydrogenase family)
MSNRFVGKTVLIIGGNSGIGRASAEAFQREGATVIITGRQQKTLDETVAANPGMEALVVDVSDLASIDAVMDQVRERHGHIDTLFVNAGVGAMMPSATLTVEFWDQVMNINLRGCFFAAQKALPLLKDGGSIVFTGAIASQMALPESMVYSAAKAGLRSVARVLGHELAGRGIRVNMVSPGPVETPIVSRGINISPQAAAAFIEMGPKITPLRRVAQPEEIAAPVLFLASEEASFITGIDLFVDGGIFNL